MGSRTGERTQAQRVRPPAQAGRFYPSSPGELRVTVESLLQPASPQLREKIRPENPDFSSPPVAVLAPHAGYIYSGAVAGAAFAALRGGGYDHVLILAPSHYGDFR